MFGKLIPFSSLSRLSEFDYRQAPLSVPGGNEIPAPFGRVVAGRYGKLRDVIIQSVHAEGSMGKEGGRQQGRAGRRMRASSFLPSQI